MSKIFIIAEAGINHMGDVEHAKSLIEAAKEAKADAIKFQTYKTEERTPVGSPIFDILKKCELSQDQFRVLKEHADKYEIELFSTPFDVNSLKFLVEDLKLKRVKIASMDLTNLEFLKEINEQAQKYYNYNVILSTGMSNSYEISKSITELQNVPYLTLLHCKSSYPLEPKNANLSAIKSLIYSFKCGSMSIGYPCNTNEIATPAAAVLVGATVIEKHFMINDTDQVVDAPVSISKNNFSKMVDLIRNYEEMLGDGVLGAANCEQGTLKYRRFS